MGELPDFTFGERLDMLDDDSVVVGYAEVAAIDDAEIVLRDPESEELNGKTTLYLLRRSLLQGEDSDQFFAHDLWPAKVLPK